jgi:hypothetical protein
MRRAIPACALVLWWWGVLPTAATAQEDRVRLQAAWDALASPDEGRASRALLTLAANPGPAVAFLGEHLPPVRDDAERIGALLDDLGSDQRARWTAAADALAYLGPYARPHVERALAAGPPAALAHRLRELLERLPQPERDRDPGRGPGRGFGPFPGGGAGSVSVQNINGQVRITVDGQTIDLDRLRGRARGAGAPARDAGRPDPWLRATRAVALLRHLGSPDARAILARLADGEPDAAPTREAKLALKELADAAP